MTRSVILVVLAAMLAGCATPATYTNPAKGNDPQAMKTALDKCEKASQAACATSQDAVRVCNQRKVQECMAAEGWTEK